MFKVCIISCGMITNAAHIPAYRHFAKDFEIAAVCDINGEAARETAARHGISAYYTDAQRMLDEQHPDVVSVCVPNCYHKQYTLMALRAGANVLCEKPLASRACDAMEMFDEAKRAGKLLMACQSMRFTPDRLAAKAYFDTHGHEDLYYGELARVRRRGIPFWGSFHKKEISLGGAFVDIGVHMLDALVWLIGNPNVVSVRAVTMQNHKNELGSLQSSGALTGKVDRQRVFDPNEMDVEDFSCGMITFAGGMRVSFKVAWAANMLEQSALRLIGRSAGIYLPECKVYFGEQGEASLTPVPSLYDSPFPGHLYLVDNLRRVLRGEASPIVTPEETINVSRIIELFYRSAELGREVFADEN